MIEYLNGLVFDTSEIVIAAASAALCIVILLILMIVLLVKQHKLNVRYKRFMDGKDGKNLEKSIMEKFSLIEKLDASMVEMNEHLTRHDENLEKAYQKIGIVKYDAFKEVGGQMSFAIAMLTKENDGFVMNCMHSSREGCYTYVKPISKGEAYVILSEEESQALEEAKSNRSLLEK